MKVLIIQHQDSVTAGTTIEWLEKNKFEYRIHFFSKGNLDTDTPYDMLVICGGSANVDQTEEFPWLLDEKAFIMSAIDKRKKIAGLCLGGQLLAELLGGKVFKAPHWETGWHNVKLLDSNAELMVFEWHGYQFISPPGSVKFAENESCLHQGFRFGDNIIGFQFHPESTTEWVKERAADPEKPAGQEFVQNEVEITEGLKYQEEMKNWYFNQLDKLSRPTN